MCPHNGGETNGDDRRGVELIREWSTSALASLDVSGVTVTVMTSSEFGNIVHASDETSARMSETQFTLAEGPTLDAFEHRHPVLVGNLADPDESSRQWMVFCGVAVSEGVGAVFAFPLTLGASRLGVLTFYRSRPGELDRTELAAALTLADRITLTLLSHGVDLQFSPLGYGYFDATTLQASGMLMVQLSVSSGEALARLRAIAFSADKMLSEVSAEVVARTLLVPRDDNLGP